MRHANNSGQRNNDNRTNEPPVAYRSKGSSCSEGGKMFKKDVQISKEDDRISRAEAGPFRTTKCNVVCGNNQHTENTASYPKK